MKRFMGHVVRFNAILGKVSAEVWLKDHTNAENLYETRGKLDGSINMVVSSDKMLNACCELMSKYLDKIKKYAVTYSGMPFINVELEFHSREDELKLIDEWDSYFDDELRFIKKVV
jgi:hypothetical protein